MEIRINTKEDSPEDIKKVARLLQNIVGENSEIFTNQPAPEQSESVGSAFANMFGEADSPQSTPPQEAAQEAAAQEEKVDSDASTNDLFAELFSEEELDKMKQAEIKEKEEEAEIKPKGKRYDVELY